MVPPVSVVMAVMVAVMVVMTVMAVMAMVTAAVHHVPTATVAAATVTAAVTTSVSIGDGEGRHADNDRCGKGEESSALRHVEVPLVCSAGIIPETVIAISPKPRLAAVLAITLLSNPPHGRGRTALDGRPRAKRAGMGRNRSLNRTVQWQVWRVEIASAAATTSVPPKAKGPRVTQLAGSHSSDLAWVYGKAKTTAAS